MNKFKRSDRVSHTIHRAISNIIESELQDSRIGMVTVTGVDLGKDLKNARIYVSVLGDDKDAELSINVLNKASSYIRARISEKVVFFRGLFNGVHGIYPWNASFGMSLLSHALREGGMK